MLSIDVPSPSERNAPISVDGNLAIIGWVLARTGRARLEVLVDGRPAGTAATGLRRPDVAQAFSDWPDALRSGFSAHVPAGALRPGARVVTVLARDPMGREASTAFRIDVTLPARVGAAWRLRSAVSPAEYRRVLALMPPQRVLPGFRLLLPVPRSTGALQELAGTLRSLEQGVYRRWHVHLVAGAGLSAAQRRRLAARFDRPVINRKDPARINVVNADDLTDLRHNELVMRLAPGDRLGADALMELAFASVRSPETELFYADDRRVDPATGEILPFFKPGWSPDLLRSTDYVGRAWCARSALLRRCGLPLSQLCAEHNHSALLRLTAAACGIEHVPRLLLETHRERTRPKRLSRVVRPGSGPAPRVSVLVFDLPAGSGAWERIDQLRRRTEYPRLEFLPVGVTRKEPEWAAACNRAAATAQGQYLLLLSAHLESRDPRWLEPLVQRAELEDTGVVGPSLHAPDDAVSHAGLAVTDRRWAMRIQGPPAPARGYFALERLSRNVLGVSSACLLTSRERFRELGGLPEGWEPDLAALDFAVRTWHRGLRNVCLSQRPLLESAAPVGSPSWHRDISDLPGDHWRHLRLIGDPYLHPNLDVEHGQLLVAREPVEDVECARPLFDADSLRRIVIFKLDHIGDAVATLPAVQRLRRAFPTARLAVVAGAASLPVWRAADCADELIEFNYFHARASRGTRELSQRALRTLERTLRERGFDLAIDLRKQPDTRHLLRLSGARWFAGFDHRGHFPWLDVALEWDEDAPRRHKHTHVSTDLIALVDRLVACTEPSGAALSAATARLRLKPELSQRLFARPLVVVHPAAGSALRQWPPEHFAQLIDGLLEARDCHVALTGSLQDRAIIRRILERVIARQHVFDLVGRVGIGELPALLRQAALFVGNNSGPQHIAAAVGAPTLGIHSGMVDAREWGPDGPMAQAVRRRMSCAPCFLEQPEQCPRALACLTDLTAGDVLERCLRLLPPTASRSAAGALPL